MRRKNPARKSAKKSGGPKMKIREKSVLPKAGPNIIELLRNYCATIASLPVTPFLGSAKSDPVRFKWGFGEGPLKDKFAFFEAYKSPIPKRSKLLENAHFYKQKGPCLKTPLNWTGSVFPLLILLRPQYPSFQGFTKGWFPKGWFWRMFPSTKNRNEGTFGCSPGTRNRNEGTFVCSPVPKTATRAHSPKPPFFETALLPTCRKAGTQKGVGHFFSVSHFSVTSLSFFFFFRFWSLSWPIPFGLPPFAAG